jgi:isoleucyl-tRNA synthetase
MFKPVSPKLDVVAMENEVLKFWNREGMLKKSVDERKGAPEYIFYEGPPTANGKPGVHHVLARVFKDMFPRYKTMRGFRVSRRGGWDTHGLPVEIEVEKQLGLKNKQQIEEYGIDKFNELCKKSVFTYIRDWERLTERIAFWVDMEDAYVTYTNEYVESVWWILKNFWDKDLLYQGYKVVPYCPRCGTPLSDHEVAQGYAEATDPSVFVRMPLVDKPGTSLLVWTTTPWTLPGNVAVAAHPDVEYVTIERKLTDDGTERLILAKQLVEKVFAGEEVKIIETFKGKKLKGTKYQPLFTFMPPDKPAHFVVLGDFVTTEDGSGLVHQAPAFGADDMQMAMEHDLPVLMTVKPDGTFIDAITPWRGMWVKDADPLIVSDLDTRGLLFRMEEYTHTYPFCWRCDTPLLYYARGTWFIRTSQYKDRLVALNQEINWVPEHIRDGRFGNWLENNVDWALGRERYWGTPLPVWECADCKHQEAIGSVAELSQKSGRDLTGTDLHRPYVDEVHWKCTKCDGKMTRVPELIDVWFDSGSMPYAQWHYPFENQEKFKTQYPADYICEAVDQTRGWFYSLHAISTLLNDQVSFKNVICLGLILDGDGQKMSKTKGNIVDPWEVLNTHGADAFRWYLYTATPPGQERRFSSDLVGSVVRDFTITLWNVYKHFVLYANIDQWQPNLAPAPAYTLLDKWLLSELNTLVRVVTEAYDTYDVINATRPLQDFVDKLSNWYLRRSKDRIWKSGMDADKHAAYSTLYAALTTLSKLLAPAMPFLAEELYQNLARSVDPAAIESVHLSNWPEVDSSLIDVNLNREMALVLRLKSLGLNAREKKNLEVKQPLSEAAFAVGNVDERRIINEYSDLLAEELNVKKIRLLDSTTEKISHVVKPLPKQLGQKYGNKFPTIQKAILAMDPEYVANTLISGVPLLVMADGQEYQIMSEEVEVKSLAPEGFALAEEGPYVAALVTTLTPELISEGQARKFVRRVQELRKQSGLDVTDRIKLFVKASQGLAHAIAVNQDYITSQTLTRELVFSELPASVKARSEDSFDGETVVFGLTKV